MWFKKLFARVTDKITKEDKSVCEICLIDTKDKVKICSCQHIYCKNCADQYLALKIKDFQIINCPYEGCKIEIDESTQFYQKLPQQTKIKYEKIKRFTFVSKNPKLKLCPKQSCDGIVDISKSKTTVCSICQQQLCSQCLYKSHFGKCDKQSLLFLQDNLNFIQCSKCDFVVEKNQGCNHIKCRCGNEFCYKCGGKWIGSSHICIKSKPFQRLRSLYLLIISISDYQYFRGVKKFLLTVIYSILVFNFVLAAVISVIQPLCAVIRIISSITSWLFNIFSSGQETKEVQPSSQSQWSFCGFLIFAAVSIFMLCKICQLPPIKYSKNWLKYGSLILLALWYFVPNLIWVFIEEVRIVVFVLDNLLTVATSLLIIAVISILLVKRTENGSRIVSNIVAKCVNQSRRILNV